MMLDLSYEEQGRFLWYILLNSAQYQVPVDSDVLQGMLPEFSRAKDEVKLICNQHRLPDLSLVMESQIIDLDDVWKLYEIKVFGTESPIESIKRHFSFVQYYTLAYPEEVADSRVSPSLHFWASLDWEKLEEEDLLELNGNLSRICQFIFVPVGEREQKKIERQKALDAFCQFSMNNTLLIIHRKDWSEAVDGLNEVSDYYQEEREDVEHQKNRAETLFENTKENLESQINEIIEDQKTKASVLVEEAKNSYRENLLSGFVKNFEYDADRHSESASRWLRGVILSFLITILVAFQLLGKLDIKIQPPEVGMVEAVMNGITIVGLWGIAIFLITLDYQGMKKLPAYLLDMSGIARWLRLLGLKTDPPSGFWSSATEAGQVAFWLVLLLLVPLYLFSSYFQISVEAPAILAENFLVPEKKKINWASLLSEAAPRILFLGLASAVTLFCVRMYRIQKHLEAMNRYRVAALGSFGTFIKATGDESDEAKKRKEELFNQLARLIYEPIQTGFMDDQKLKATDLANLVAAATKKSE